MVADLWFQRSGAISGLRVRYGFLGRPILQLQRELFRVPMNPYAQEERSGKTQWKDATRDDMPEVQAFLLKASA